MKEKQKHSSLQKPEISVLMAIHNGERFLKEAIDSILAQTFTDFEFIIVDDASTDTTASILDSYNDKRIVRLTNKTNLGLTKSLNIGLAQAHGTYTARMDADDISLPNRLKVQKKFLDEHPNISAVGSETEIMNVAGTQIGYKKVQTDPAIIKFLLITANQLYHSTIMMHSAVIKKIGGYDENYRYAQDFELWSRLSRTGCQMSNIPVPLLKYRLHEKSITQASQSRSHAYEYSKEIISNNIRHHIECTDEEIEIFLNSFHQHEITSIREINTVSDLLDRLQSAYIRKISPDAKTSLEIGKFTKDQKMKAVRWYIKNKIETLRS